MHTPHTRFKSPIDRETRPVNEEKEREEGERKKTHSKICNFRAATTNFKYPPNTIHNNPIFFEFYAKCMIGSILTNSFRLVHPFGHLFVGYLYLLCPFVGVTFSLELDSKCAFSFVSIMTFVDRSGLSFSIIVYICIWIMPYTVQQQQQHAHYL